MANFYSYQQERWSITQSFFESFVSVLRIFILSSDHSAKWKFFISTANFQLVFDFTRVYDIRFRINKSHEQMFPLNQLYPTSC